MAQQKQSLDKKKQDELRAAYDKEQEILNNKALLGDEKARLGLAFMYDAPAGLKKEEKEITPAMEPKFEWQRKYNAPREDWAKGDDSIADQPFGIQVRNVRCVKCHTWGHINTDRECKLYNMSGNHEDPGLTTNPSDIIREMKRGGKNYSCTMPPAAGAESDRPGTSTDAKKREKLNPEDLMSEMRTEYGLSLKPHIVDGVRTDEALKKMDTKKVEAKTETDEKNLMFDFLQSLSEKERAKIFNKFFDSNGETSKKKKKSKKHRKKEKKEKKKKRRRSRSRSRS